MPFLVSLSFFVETRSNTREGCHCVAANSSHRPVRSKPVPEQMELVIEVFGTDDPGWRSFPITTVTFPLTEDLRDGASHELRPAGGNGAPGVAVRLLWRQAGGAGHALWRRIASVMQTTRTRRSHHPLASGRR
jgi:hypothetical protein